MTKCPMSCSASIPSRTCHAERSSEGAKRPHCEVEASLPPANRRGGWDFDVAALGYAGGPARLALRETVGILTSPSSGLVR